MIYCPKCGTANRDGSKFCNECGANLGTLARTKCPHCGTLNPITSEVCSACEGVLAVADAPAQDPDEDSVTSPLIAGAAAHVVESVGEQSPEPETTPSAVPSWVQEIEAASSTPSDTGGPGEMDGPVPQPERLAVPDTQGQLPAETQMPPWLEPSAEPDSAQTSPERLDDGKAVPAWLASLRLAEAQAKQAAEAPDTELSDSLRPVEPEKVVAEKPPAAINIDEIEALAPLTVMPAALQLAKPITRSRTATKPGSPPAEPAMVQSILALDYGSTVTRALLIDRAAGDYRFVGHADAPSAGGAPWNGERPGARHSLSQLSSVMDRPLLDDDGHVISPEGDDGGVDVVVAITSAGQPPRVVLVGTAGDESLLCVSRTLSATHAKVERIVTLDGHNGGRRGDDLGKQVQLILDATPDAVVLVGSSDREASEPILLVASAVAMACSTLPAAARPSIIFSGDATMQGRITETVGADARVRIVDRVPGQANPAQPGPLQAEMEALSPVSGQERLPGSQTLFDWSAGSVLPASRAFARTIHDLACLEGINVLGIEVGGSTATIASVIDEQLDLAVCTELGMGPGLTQLLDRVPAEALLRWLPFEIDPAGMQNILYNKSLRSGTLPQTRRDLFLEQAAAREIIGMALAEPASHWPKGASRIYSDLLPRFHLIVGAGGVLANAPSYGQAALILLDALQPVGVSGLALDPAGLVAPLGAVAAVSPLAAAQVLERDGLLSLGTVVAPVGKAREGEIALSMRIEHMDGRSYAMEVPYGSLEVLPLPIGQTADLELQPARQFDVGLGSRGQAGRTRVTGGAIGVIVDARGRPLQTAPDAEDQRKRMEDWLWDIGA